MKRWRILLVAATAIACISCGAAVIGGQTSTAPTIVRGASVTTINHPSVSTQGGSSAAAGAVVKQPAQSQLPPRTVINPQPAQNLPAPIVNNPCSRAGKPAPMCAVAAP
jgi:hypothetical protein